MSPRRILAHLALVLAPLLPSSIAAQIVTPKGDQVTVDPQSTSVGALFTIENATGSDQTFWLQCNFSGAVTSCSGPGSIFVAAWSFDAVQVTYNTGSPGTGEVGLYLDGSDFDYGWYDVTVENPTPPAPPTYTVGVSPDGQQVAPPPFSQPTQIFTIQNTGTAGGTYDLAGICAPPAATTCAAPASVFVGAGSWTNVNVTYKTGEAGLTGTVRLRASYQGDPTVSDDGTVSVIVAPGGPSVTVVSVADAGPGASADRDLCLTVGVGANAAFECGDLRVAHGLPGVTTLNTARAPTLLYNSRHAQASPLLAALVTLAGGAATPTRVTASLWVKPAGTGSWVNPSGASGEWDGAGFTAGRPARIALSYDAAGTGIQLTDYRFDVTVWYGGTPQSVVVSPTGQFVLVDRSQSPFGAGWWLAGLERLYFPQDGSLAWVGGDGSTRRYASTGISNVWAAQAVDRPDTLKWISGSSRYVRYLPHGLKVQFDVAGLHKETVNRLGYTTAFGYDGSVRPSTITVPKWSVPTFAFTYFGTDSVLFTAPSATGPSRTLRLALTSGTARSIRDPDDKIVAFEYTDLTAPRRITALVDRRLTRTRFGYGSGHALEYASLDSLTDVPWREHRFTPVAETQGLWIAAGQALAVRQIDVYTRYDGPRVATDVLDHTTFWPDRFGAPSKIQNALGAQTVLVRGDARFPALVTEQRSPNGFRTWATYDARGNVVSSTRINPLDDGRNATTTYEWDAKWDFVKKVTLPEGEITRTSYSETTGNRNWQEDGRGVSSRTDFAYNTAGSAIGQLASVTMPAAPNGTRAKDTLSYDALANVSQVRRARGTVDERVTRFTGDGIGRTILTATDITVDSATQRRDSTAYDVMNRVIATKSYSFNMAPAETLFTQTVYDEEGNTRRLERWSSPNVSAIGTIVTRWGYDRAKQVVADTAPDGLVERRTYDAAGNIRTVTTRRGHVITSTYDILNRLETRTVPSVTYQDTLAGIGAQDSDPYPRRPNSGNDYVIAQAADTFAYDPLDTLMTANNGDARVTRTYYRSGALKTEKQEIRDAIGPSFSHSYPLGHTYDLNGRRRAVKLPSQLVPSGTRDSVAFAYDTLTGELKTVTDPLGNVFTYSYTLRGEPASLEYPGLYTRRWSYLLDGSLGRDSVLNTGGISGGRLPNAILRATKLDYDYRGKMTATRDAMGFQDTVLTTYSGLGHLLTSYMSQNGQVVGRPITHRYSTGEQQAYDALGNMTTALSVDTSKYNGVAVPTSYRNHTQTYSVGVGRLISESSADGDKTHVYDADGNLEFSMREAGEWGKPSDDRFTYYAADGRVRAADFRFKSNGMALEAPRGWVFEEFRYDAIGRRIWVRTYRECPQDDALTPAEGLECQISSLRRTIWDGEQELMEIQVPGGATQTSTILEDDDYLARLERTNNADPNPFYGRVLYVHGLQLDQPIAITRYRYVDNFSGTTYTDFLPSTFSLFWNARGQIGFVACATGNQECQHDGRNMWLDLSQSWSAYNRGKFTKHTFQGTLIHDKQDGVQTLYRRNRYYDPSTGRFTQEDPIGLAGGLNLYGFANGDPVNFSDPFGLCPPAPSCLALAGGATVTDGPLPIGDVVAVGLLAAAAYYTLVGVGAAVDVRYGPKSGYPGQVSTMAVADALPHTAAMGKKSRAAGIMIVGGLGAIFTGGNQIDLSDPTRTGAAERGGPESAVTAVDKKDKGKQKPKDPNKEGGN